MCPDGFLLGSDWATCEDVDECENDQMGCDQLCINTPGSYQVKITSLLCTSHNGENHFKMNLVVH